MLLCLPWAVVPETWHEIEVCTEAASFGQGQDGQLHCPQGGLVRGGNHGRHKRPALLEFPTSTSLTTARAWRTWWGTLTNPSDHNPKRPLCTRLTLGGRFVRVTDEDELSFAQNALFSRHPEMKAWILAHVFYVAKLEIDFIWLIDFYGGASIIDPKDYFAVSM